MLKSTVQVCCSNIASLHLAAELVPIWYQVGWAQPGSHLELCWLSTFPSQELCCKELCHLGAVLGECVKPRCSSALQESERLHVEAPRNSMGDGLGLDGLMSWKLTGYVRWEYTCEVICSSFFSETIYLSFPMFYLGHSDPCCRRRYCMLSLAQGRVLMRGMKKCLSSSVSWGSNKTSVFLVFPCFPVYLFLVHCWCTEIWP